MWAFGGAPSAHAARAMCYTQRLRARTRADAICTRGVGILWLPHGQLTMALEEEFGLEIPDAEADKIASLPDAINYLASHPAAK